MTSVDRFLKKTKTRNAHEMLSYEMLKQLYHLFNKVAGTGSSKSVHVHVNYSLLLKLLRQIMQLPNLPDDVNSIVLRALSYVLTVCWQ